MSKTFSIRKAKSCESDLLTSIVQRSKAHWGYPEKWMEIWEPRLTVKEHIIVNWPTYLAELDREAFGFWCREPRQTDEITDGFLFIDPKHLRKGIAKTLGVYIKADLLKRKINDFTLAADPNAIPFYESIGSVKIGETNSPGIEGRKIPVLKFNLKD